MQRQIAISDTTDKTTTTKNPEFANKIIQLAINRTSKSRPTPNNSNEITGQASAPNSLLPSPDEIEKNQQDLDSLNNDLKLLSTLLGRPVSDKDIPQLKQPSPNQSSRSPIEADIPTTTERTKKITSTYVAATHEVGLLETILQNQPTTPSGTSDLFIPDVDAGDTYGKTNDALLATILKQRGIGPAHNNIPVDLFSTTTSTPRPRPRTTTRSSRPLLDGLSWLWRTWQETAPGYRQPTVTSTSSRTRTRGLAPADTTASQTGQSGHVSFDDGLDSDSSSVRNFHLKKNSYL